ncbi:MAG: AAA family ATPase [Bacilli bacterium]|nr:AAA family ATPase [Bacilli bacterium]
MRIAIEGLDGVGKTAIAKYLASVLNYEYKRDHLDNMLGIDEEHFFKIKDKIKDYDDVRTLLFMSSLAYVTKEDKNVIYDRFILSEYYYDGTKDTFSWFDNYCKTEVLPDLTIILYASDQVRRERLQKRNMNDPDLKKMFSSEEMYKKMIYFANYANLNYVVIDTDNLSIEDVKNIVLNYVYEFINNKKLIKR